MAKGKTVLEVTDLMPKVKEIFDINIQMIRENKISLYDLVFTKRISKDFGDYDERSTVENHALTQLSEGGKSLKAGQILKYVVTNYYNKNAVKRSIPIGPVTSKTRYDVRRYTELFTETCNSITEPFGMKISNETQLP